jgi:hypothetical protein
VAAPSLAMTIFWGFETLSFDPPFGPPQQTVRRKTSPFRSALRGVPVILEPIWQVRDHALRLNDYYGFVSAAKDFE